MDRMSKYDISTLNHWEKKKKKTMKDNKINLRNFLCIR